MPETLPEPLAGQLFAALTAEEVDSWVQEVDATIRGTSWLPVGGIDNNVHTVEVASDPALALVERPTNSIDALLDLRARERGETAATPQEAARRWWDIPPGGVSALPMRERRHLADKIRITMLESGDAAKPTITVQDQGTGQHPDDFAGTLLSLLASNKKRSTHLMGVYNAGGAASYRFASRTVLVSRLAPALLDGRDDVVGATVVRYNPLDPDRYKSGVYEYLAARDGSILRLALPELPDLPHGTYVKLIEYSLPRHARAAYEPKRSLWQLINTALPDPALPVRLMETRAERFPGVRNEEERRVAAGLIAQLSRRGVADYADRRTVSLGAELGSAELRYFVVNDGSDPDAYTTSDQGLTVTLNGQRQTTRTRDWLKHKLQLYYLYKRLVVVVDATGLTSTARREMFSSTRETGVDTPLARTLLERVVGELEADDSLGVLDELAKQSALQSARRTTSDKVRRRLAGQIASRIRGEGKGSIGGSRSRPERRPRTPRPTPPPVDDSQLLEVPDLLRLITDPIRVRQGATTSLQIEVNAKNDFLPAHKDGLSIVFDAGLKGQLEVRSTGRLLGGRSRIALAATADTPLGSYPLKVALVVPSLSVLLTAESSVEVLEPADTGPRPSDRTGGQPDIEVSWVGRDQWADQDPPWDSDTVGTCNLYRDHTSGGLSITRVEWTLNEAFTPFERVTQAKQLSEPALRSFREGYELPVLWGLFEQRLAEETQSLGEVDSAQALPDYGRGERARLARAVLLAMEPDMAISDS